MNKIAQVSLATNHALFLVRFGSVRFGSVRLSSSTSRWFWWFARAASLAIGVVIRSVSSLALAWRTGSTIAGRLLLSAADTIDGVRLETLVHF